MSDVQQELLDRTNFVQLIRILYFENGEEYSNSIHLYIRIAIAIYSRNDATSFTRNWIPSIIGFRCMNTGIGHIRAF